MLYAQPISLLFILALLASGCAPMVKTGNIEPTTAFNVCYSYGCKKTQSISLSEEQWHLINQAFMPLATTPSEERHRLSMAIAEMEKIVGTITQTENDLPGTFAALFKKLDDQMDCVDEATNTTSYIKLFRERGLIHFHQEEPRINRGFFFNGWPHTSAVIEEINTKKRFAVDSWFHKNGVRPEIIPVQLWYSGWHPDPKAINN